MAGRRKTKPAQIPDPATERKIIASGARYIVGVDEAGRGCWAGPVYAAAVMLDSGAFTNPSPLEGVRDSKLLSRASRERLFAKIDRNAIAVSVARIEARIVDGVGIVEATREAMLQALDGLPMRPDFVLVDSLQLPATSEYSANHLAFDHADWLCLSVAAASICAKVSRDRDMIRRSARYPGYGFETNMGYGTPQHRAGLKRIGPCPIHRKTFRPIKESLLRGEGMAALD